jgi:hypothetical protein
MKSVNEVIVHQDNGCAEASTDEGLVARFAGLVEQLKRQNLKPDNGSKKPPNPTPPFPSGLEHLSAPNQKGNRGDHFASVTPGGARSSLARGYYHIVPP